MEKIKKLLDNNKQTILYLFFGVCTTATNFVTYFLCTEMGISVTVSTVIAWFVSVIFAYVTNRIYVFESQHKDRKEVIKELVTFFSCRVATGVIDVIIMYVFVEIMRYNDLIIKVASNIFVTVLNYTASKLWIFKK